LFVCLECISCRRHEVGARRSRANAGLLPGRHKATTHVSKLSKFPKALCHDSKNAHVLIPLGELESMAGSEVSPAKTILLAIRLATSAELLYLESLVFRNPRTLHLELILRILLSYLPDTLPSTEYVPFLQRLDHGGLLDDAQFDLKKCHLNQFGDEDAKRKARKLHLQSLSWPSEVSDESPSPLVRFLVLRSLAIDESTGMIDQVPELLKPFLHQSSYLRTWMISTILPLVRFNYEYHPDNALIMTISEFEKLDDQACVKLLLSRTAGDKGNLVGQDIRGLVGPWTYGDTRWKRRRTRKSSQVGLQNITPLNDTPAVSDKCRGWEAMFKWITTQADSSWGTAVEAIEQWDGPGDVDVGGYDDGSTWLDEDEQQYLERRYARAAVATAYIIPDASEDALKGVQRIVDRIISLLDLDRVPTLPAAASLLSPVAELNEDAISTRNIQYLRNDHLSEANMLTTPGEQSVKLLHALLVSAYLCTRVGSNLSIKQVAELVLFQDKREQTTEFNRFISNVSNGPKGDKKYWIKLRNEVLWLRSWGAEELSEGTTTSTGKGIFGTLSKEFVDAELLKLFLSNTRKHACLASALLLKFVRIYTRSINLSTTYRSPLIESRFS
jgi:hypothetical protein